MGWPLARRARAKFSSASPRADVNEFEHQAVTEKFITACATGDLNALAAVLDPASLLTSERLGGVEFRGDPTVSALS